MCGNRRWCGRAAHVAEAGLGDRIEIRHQDVTTLAERDRYDCGWLPAPFLPREVLAAAIPRVIEAVKPGGLVAIGVQRTPDDPLAAATQRLRNICDTGACPTVDSVLAMCHEAGLDATVLNPDATIPISWTSVDGSERYGRSRLAHRVTSVDRKSARRQHLDRRIQEVQFDSVTMSRAPTRVGVGAPRAARHRMRQRR